MPVLLRIRAKNEEADASITAFRSRWRTGVFMDYSILYICTEFIGIHYLISAFISYSLSTVFNYIASVYWVFDTNKTKSKGQTF